MITLSPQRPPAKVPSLRPLFGITYRAKSGTWRTVVEAVDREVAIEQFKRQNPHVELLSCEASE
jgi:hypothetical protein